MPTISLEQAQRLYDRNDQREFARHKESDFLAYKNAAGEVADFHSIRHTYISGIVASGASVKVAQTLARHSTPTLTIGRYAHARLHDLQGALDGLPDQSPTIEPGVLRATGTDNAQPSTGTDEKWAHFGAQLGGESGQNAARSGEPGKDDRDVCTEKSTDVDRCKVLSLSALGNNITASCEMRREAEGTRLELATPCGAPHFQLPCAFVHYRRESSQAVHGRGVGARAKIRNCLRPSANVRRFGYKLATKTPRQVVRDPGSGRHRIAIARGHEFVPFETLASKAGGHLAQALGAANGCGSGQSTRCWQWCSRRMSE